MKVAVEVDQNLASVEVHATHNYFQRIIILFLCLSFLCKCAFWSVQANALKASLVELTPGTISRALRSQYAINPRQIKLGMRVVSFLHSAHPQTHRMR